MFILLNKNTITEPPDIKFRKPFAEHATYTSRKTALLVLFIRTSYFDHKSNIETKMKRMKGTQVSRQRYRAAL